MTTLIQSLHQSRTWLTQNTLRWVRPLLIAGLLLLSVMLPVIGSLRLLQMILLMVLGLGGLFLFWRWPPLGLILTLLGGMFIPFSGPAGVNVAALGIALLLGLWVLDMLVGQQQTRLVSSRPIKPLLIFVLIAVLAFIVGQLPWFSFATHAPLDAQVGGLAIFVLAAGAFLLVSHQVRDVDWLRWITWIFLAVGALQIATWLVPEVGNFARRFFQNGTANNAAFWVWLVAMAFSQAFLNRKLHIVWRLGLGGLAIATLYVAFFLNGGWKSGYLPALVTVAAIVVLSHPRVGVILILAGFLPARYLASQAIATDEFSYGTRLDAWSIMLEIGGKNPLLGLGPANYYWYVPLYRIRGYFSVFSSHNQYLDIIVQTGLLGLACILWFVWEVGWLGWRLRTQVPEGFARAYVYGVLGGLAGILAASMLADWLLPFVYNIGLTGFRASVLTWVFLGGLVSLEQVTKQQSTVA